MPHRELRITDKQFETKCLRLIDQVALSRMSIVITKRGKPVAKLVPTDSKLIDLFGYMAGTIEITGDTVSPIDDVEWTADAENI